MNPARCKDTPLTSVPASSVMNAIKARTNSVQSGLDYCCNHLRTHFNLINTHEDGSNIHHKDFPGIKVRISCYKSGNTAHYYLRASNELCFSKAPCIKPEKDSFRYTLFIKQNKMKTNFICLSSLNALKCSYTSSVTCLNRINRIKYP
jgi:hypothetical protein